MRWPEAIGEVVLLTMSAAFASLGYAWLDADHQGYEPGPRDPATLRVVTWNVGGAGDRDGVPLDDEWIPNVAETLEKLDADLAFLQELAGPSQLDDLLGRLGGQWDGAIAPGRGRRIAVLFQRGDIRTYRVPTGSRRDAALVVYRNDHHPPVAAVALHADAYSSHRRNRQIGRAVDALISMSRVRAKILVGDLNVDVDPEKRRDLFTQDDHRDVESYNYVTKHLFDAAVGGGSTAEPDRRLDYIFANDALGVAGAGPWKGRRVSAMDHDPVVADFQFVGR